MGIIDSAKQKLDELTGAAQRQREARQKAELAQQAEADRRASDKEKQIAADKAQAESRERSKAERQELGNPAARIASQVVPGQEDRMREPRQQKPEPEKAPEIAVRVAEQNQYRPTEFVRGPSIGGGPAFSSPTHKATHDRQQQHQRSQQQEPPKREPTPIEKFQETQKAQVQDRSSQVLAQKQTREQQIQALNKELGL